MDKLTVSCARRGAVEVTGSIPGQEHSIFCGELAIHYNNLTKIPAIITNCSNNYGPNQHPEKLIPKLIYNIINNISLPIYGKGINSREWIYVKDHCEALLRVFYKGKIGEDALLAWNDNPDDIPSGSQLLVSSKKKAPETGALFKLL